VKTTITGRHGREAVVTHYLDDDEKWERFGMDQPNPIFSHDEGFSCPACLRPLRSLGRQRGRAT